VGSLVNFFHIYGLVDGAVSCHSDERSRFEDLFPQPARALTARELGFLALFLVLLASVFTLSGLNVVGFP